LATPRSTGAARARQVLSVVGLAVALAAGATPGLGQADPRPSLEQVQRRVDALNAQADLAVEAFAQARIRLDAARRRAEVSHGRVLREEAALRVVRRQIGAVASSAYRSGGADALMSLVGTTSPQAFLDRASALDRIAHQQAEQLAATATARHRLATVEAQAARDLAAQQDAESALARQKQAIERTLATERTMLAGLRADQRARLQAARDAAARQARATRERVDVFASYTGPASGRAGVAVAEAYNKLGSPYEWAAAGPSRFDCSGLTMWVWAKAGVALPHSAQAQYDGSRHVAQSDVQPGDLVFFGSPIHHVGIYIGGGRMISAPHTGDVVKIQDAFRSDYVGAARP